MGLQIKRGILYTLLTNISRFVLALVLMVSGFVKAVDPMGAMYKLQEYASAFSADILSDDWLLFFAILQAALEFLAGLFLLMGVYRKPMAAFVLLMFMFFTPFTLYIAIAGPVDDCGCFGEAVTLTNTETFLKNLFLLLLAVVVFLGRRRFVCHVSSRSRWMVVIFAIFYIAVLEGVSLSHLPVVDFRPYAVGNDLRAMLQSSYDTYDVVMVYEKDGERREFASDELPDSSWMFVESRSVLVSKGEKPMTGDFSIVDWDNDYDIAGDVLADSGYVCILAIENVDEASVSRVDKVNDLYDYCLENSVPFYAATSSDEDEIALWRMRTGAEYPIYWADAALLRTMVRANPGLVLLKDGVVVGKWGASDIPDVELMYASPTRMPDEVPTFTSSVRGWRFWMLFLFAPLAFIVLIDFVSGRGDKTALKAEDKPTGHDKNVKDDN